MGRLDWAREVFQGEKMAIQVLYLLGYASKFGKNCFEVESHYLTYK